MGRYYVNAGEISVISYSGALSHCHSNSTKNIRDCCEVETINIYIEKTFLKTIYNLFDIAIVALSSVC